MADNKNWTTITYPTSQYYDLVGGKLIPIDPNSEKGKELAARSHEILKRTFDSFVERPNG